MTVRVEVGFGKGVVEFPGRGCGSSSVVVVGGGEDGLLLLLAQERVCFT